LGLTQN